MVSMSKGTLIKLLIVRGVRDKTPFIDLQMVLLFSALLMSCFWVASAHQFLSLQGTSGHTSELHFSANLPPLFFDFLAAYYRKEPIRVPDPRILLLLAVVSFPFLSVWFCAFLFFSWHLLGFQKEVEGKAFVLPGHFSQKFGRPSWGMLSQYL